MRPTYHLLICLFLTMPAFGQIPTDNLALHFRFDGNADDESGNGNHGTLYGPALAEDRFGNPNSAYDFDGVDDYIDFGTDASTLLKQSMSVSLWMKLAGFPNEGVGLIQRHGYGDTEPTNVPFAANLLNSNGTTRWWAAHEWGSGNDASSFSVAEVEADVWYHVGIVRDHLMQTYTFYINGKFDSNHSYSINPTGGEDTRGYVGTSNSLTPVFNGVLDDMRLYSRVLSEDEILELYNEGTGDPLAEYGVCYGTTGIAEPTYPGYLLTIDPLTGAGTLVGATGIIGDSGPSVPAIAIKSTGEIYAVSASTSSGLYTVDASTGAGTFVVNIGLSLPNAMAFDGYDQLYIADGSSNLYTLDETTGSSTLIGPLGFNVRGIAFDPTDGTMYGSSGTDGIYTIDPTTATATFVGQTGLGGSIPDIHFDLDGNLFGTKIGGGTIYNLASIDRTTGAGTVVGSIGYTGVIGLSTRQVRSDVIPVTIATEIDSVNQTVPPEGATFPYEITFTNNTPRTQTVDYWTRIERPAGNPFDPFDGPTPLTLDPLETVLVDTNEITVPANAVPGDYSLIGYVGTYQSDTLHSDTTGFTKLDEPSIPCADIDRVQARCRPGGLVQVKVVFTDFTHVGDTVEISVDQFPYLVPIGLNGQAKFSQTGFNPGVHTVELTDPPGCFPATQVTCGAGVAMGLEDDWDETWETPAATTLIGNYPNPFNPSTTFRYALSEPNQVSLKVYNMLGQLVRTVVNEQQAEGYYEAIWDGRNETGSTVSSGIYIYRMTAGSFVQTERMMLLK